MFRGKFRMRIYTAGRRSNTSKNRTVDLIGRGPHSFRILEIVRQSAKELELLTVQQAGWDFNPLQLSRYEEPSQASLIQAEEVGLTQFRLNLTYDQRLHVGRGFYTFGTLHPDCATAWHGSQAIPSNALMVFPSEEDMAAISHKGFHGNGIHLRASYLDSLAQDLYGIQLDRLLPPIGMI